MATTTALLICANCGKGEDGTHSLKVCTACMMVKYCNRECQIAHRPHHKKACKKRAAELHDEMLFKEVEPEECPICLLPQSGESRAKFFQSCCGKCICNGCMYAMETSGGKDLCPFCRAPPASSYEESINQIKNLMEKGNAYAFDFLAGLYDDGDYGLPQNKQKACELWLKAGELGCSDAYFSLSYSYHSETGLDSVMNQKAKHFCELAAMSGNVVARHNLAVDEWNAGNYHRAKKLYLVAAKAGYTDSLDVVKGGFIDGIITKDEYEKTLRAYHERRKEIESDERDKAAACIGGM